MSPFLVRQLSKVVAGRRGLCDFFRLTLLPLHTVVTLGTPKNLTALLSCFLGGVEGVNRIAVGHSPVTEVM